MIREQITHQFREKFKTNKNIINAGGLEVAPHALKMSEWSGVDGWIPLRLL